MIRRPLRVAVLLAVAGLVGGAVDEGRDDRAADAEAARRLRKETYPTYSPSSWYPTYSPSSWYPIYSPSSHYPTYSPSVPPPTTPIPTVSAREPARASARSCVREAEKAGLRAIRDGSLFDGMDRRRTLRHEIIPGANIYDNEHITDGSPSGRRRLTSSECLEIRIGPQQRPDLCHGVQRGIQYYHRAR